MLHILHIISVVVTNVFLQMSVVTKHIQQCSIVNIDLTTFWTIEIVQVIHLQRRPIQYNKTKQNKKIKLISNCLTLGFWFVRQQIGRKRVRFTDTTNDYEYTTVGREPTVERNFNAVGTENYFSPFGVIQPRAIECKRRAVATYV